MECRICKAPTEVQFALNKKLVPICKKCSSDIFIQQAKLYHSQKSIYDIPAKVKKSPPRHPEIACEILNFLQEKLGREGRYTPETIPKVFLEHISARVEEGHTLPKMKAVVHFKHKEWNNDVFMKKFLRPATLFNREKFNTYVAEVPEDFNPDNTKEQRSILRKLSNYGIRGTVNGETDRLAKELIATGYTNKNLLNTYLIQKL